MNFFSFIDVFSSKYELLNSGCGLSASAAYTPVFTVLGCFCLSINWNYSRLPLSRTPAILNLPLSRTETCSPCMFCLMFFSHLLWPISNSVILNPPLSRTKCEFLWSKLTPLISNCGNYDVKWMTVNEFCLVNWLCSPKGVSRGVQKWQTLYSIQFH